MIPSLLGFIALGGLAVLVWRIRRELAQTEDEVRQPKGWISPNATFDEALRVADRHLATARAGANARLQYGQTGCLTMIRARPRGGDPGFVARWEFWRPDEPLARRLLKLPARQMDRPKQTTLELLFADDYLSFRNAMETAFTEQAIVEGNMHLTWNC